MDAMHEGFHNEMGRILARQALTPTSYKLPAFAASTPYVATPNFGDNIFGVEAYICSNCLAVKPSTLCYVEGDKGGGSQYRLYCPPNAAKSPSDYGSTREEFMARARKYCLGVLLPSVIAWMGNQVELIAAEIEDPNRSRNGQITFLKTEAEKIFSVTLHYSEERCIRLDPSKTGSWALRAINNKHTTLDQSELSEFLGKTETTSYGFFRMAVKDDRRAFLMAVTKKGSNATLRLMEDNSTKFSRDVNIPNQRSEDVTTSTFPS